MNKEEPSEAVTRLIDLLDDHPNLSCTEIGEALWPTPKYNRQAMARPAGKLVKQAIKGGWVKERVKTNAKYSRREFYNTQKHQL